jgi:hypothetical protein
MTESKRAFRFKETRTPSFYRGSYGMRCYFIRGRRLIRDSRLNFTINRANAEQTKDNSALGLTMSAVARRLDWLRRCH